MSLDGEPPRGDYAAYIDRLVNRGAGAPGAQSLMRPGAQSAPDIPGVLTTPTPPAPTPGGHSEPFAASAPPARAGAPTAAGNAKATLAQLGSQAARGNIQTLLAALFGLAAVVSIASAFNDHDPLRPANIFRTLILFLIARGLYMRGRRNSAGAQRVPGSPQPPFVPGRLPPNEIRPPNADNP